MSGGCRNVCLKLTNTRCRVETWVSPLSEMKRWWARKKGFQFQGQDEMEPVAPWAAMISEPIHSREGMWRRHRWWILIAWNSSRLCKCGQDFPTPLASSEAHFLIWMWSVIHRAMVQWPLTLAVTMLASHTKVPGLHSCLWLPTPTSC